MAGEQTGWNFCTKCGSMTFSNIPAPCVAGGNHNPQGFPFVMPHGQPAAPGSQGHFRRCQKCSGMFLAEDVGSGAIGACVVGNPSPHNPDTSLNFHLAHDIGDIPGAQGKWFVCVNCNLLFFGPDGGHCVKNSLSHDPGQGNFPEFVLPHN
jgi:hypothetical protein